MKRPQVIISALIFAAALVFPLFVNNDYLLQVVFRIFLFATLGLAWNLVGGYAGQLSLGHAAFFGIGAYGIALLGKGVSPWIAIVGGVIASLIAALIIGSISFRLRGPYFCLATIAFAEVVRLIAKNLPNVTGGDVGTTVPLLFPHNSMRSFYYACVILTIASFAICFWVERSRFGYYLMAIREDEDTAQSVGVNTARVKLWSLLLSAALSAVAGALYASLFLYIVPDPVLGIELSVEIAILPMLGGAGTLVGPVIGSVVLETANEVFKNIFKEAHLLIYGILIVLVVLFLPEGIVGTINRKFRWRKPSMPTPFLNVPPPGPAEESKRVPLPQAQPE